VSVTTPQVFFSTRCPLFQRRLSFMHKLLYTNGENRHLVNPECDTAATIPAAATCLEVLAQ
jgi:hypothetical protein